MKSTTSPGAKFVTLMENRLFARTWSRRRADFEEADQSAYDASLAAHAVRAGWSDQEITDLLVAHRCRHGQEQEQELERLDYYQRTIGNIRDEVANSDLEEAAQIDELNSTTYPEEPQFEFGMALHKRIRLARRALELSQLEVAVHIGISQSQFSLFEQGYVKLPADVVGAIQQFLRDAQHREPSHA